MSNNFKFAPHTVVITVGPSCCGKSTWVYETLESAYEHDVPSVKVISSDAIRTGLIPAVAYPDTRNSATMLMVSEQAFELLFAQLEAHTSFPVNTDLIFVDTTGLDNQFRERVRSIAKANGYNVVLAMFDYSRGDLEKFVGASDNGNLSVTLKHSKRMREELMPNLQRKLYDGIIKFNKPEQASSFVAEFDRDLISCCEFVVENDDKVAVIGDVHECIAELDKLTNQLVRSGVTKFVFCGDWIDKGGDTKATIEYLADFAKSHDVRFALGNHERYVFRRLAGQIQPQPEVESKYFSGVEALLDDPTTKALGQVIYDKSTPFVLIRSNDWMRRPIYVTHAPCKTEYIGKVTKEAIQHQCNIYFKDRDIKTMHADLEFVEKQSQSNYPWHVFGHVAHDAGSPVQVRNTIWLDTGCVHGGSLSAAVFDGSSFKPQFVSVDAIGREPTERYSFPKKGKVDRIADAFIELSEEDERRAKWAIKHGVKYISGTMTPAAAWGDDIESVDAAVDYFVKSGITEVCAQPKYMGSRAQIYLIKNDKGELDLEKTFATSRNGYKIKVDLTAIYQEMFGRYHHLFERELILDGELCPWSVLGRQLIDNEFGQYQAAIEYQLALLADDAEYAKFDTSKLIDHNQKAQHLNAFKQQLDLYGQDGDPYYMPFGIIAIDDKWQGNEDQCVMFTDILGSAGGQAFDLSKPEDVDALKVMIQLITEIERMEGVVIKPRVYKEGCLPYMKVRNKEYMRLIYGYDYQDRLERLCKQKSIRGKSRISIEEYQLGRAMVEQPELREKAIFAMFGQIAKERDLDPRL